MKDEVKAGDGPGYKVAAFFLIAPTCWWFGFVTSKLWLWYMVPLGAPVIGVAMAYGLRVLVKWLTMDLTTTRKERTVLEAIVSDLVGPAIFLGAGWVGTLFL